MKNNVKFEPKFKLLKEVEDKLKFNYDSMIKFMNQTILVKLSETIVKENDK